MARKLTKDNKADSMSVLGESYPLSALPGDTAVYPRQLHELEVASWLERPKHDQSFDCRRPFKRPRSNEEQYQSVSSPKRFISEEVVASHLQQLNLASSSTPPLSHATTANTTGSATLASSQTPTCSLTLSSTPLLAIPLLTSSDLLTTAARSCPLSIKTVASCPRSLEANKDEMVCDDQIGMNNTSKPSASSAQSSSNSNYSTVVTSAQLIHQTESLIDERMNNGEVDEVYQSIRTSPGHHKRPACELDEEDGESEERIEGAERGEVLSAGPYTKRSKVDVRVTSTSDFMSCDALPLSFSLPRDQLQGMISDESSQCSSTDSGETITITSSSSSSKTLGMVILEDGSDSSDGGQEPGPEKPLSLWLAPELQALSSSCGQLLPPAILEKINRNTPKGMELVPWVGGPSVLAKVEEKEQVSIGSTNEDNLNCDTMEP